jgi:hypothetical protein
MLSKSIEVETITVVVCTQGFSFIVNSFLSRVIGSYFPAALYVNIREKERERKKATQGYINGQK